MHYRGFLACLHLADDSVVVIVVGALGVGGRPGPVVGVQVAGAGGALPQQLDAAALQLAHPGVVRALAPPIINTNNTNTNTRPTSSCTPSALR